MADEELNVEVKKARMEDRSKLLNDVDEELIKVCFYYYQMSR